MIRKGISVELADAIKAYVEARIAQAAAEVRNGFAFTDFVKSTETRLGEVLMDLELGLEDQGLVEGGGGDGPCCMHCRPNGRGPDSEDPANQ
jgi:hypothetical protein